MIVLDQCGIPLVSLAADKPVKAVVAQAQRPALLCRADAERIDRHVVVLADPKRAPSGIAQHLRDRAVFHWDMAAVARESDGHFRDRAKTIRVVVAAG